MASLKAESRPRDWRDSDLFDQIREIPLFSNGRKPFTTLPGIVRALFRVSSDEDIDGFVRPFNVGLQF